MGALSPLSGSSGSSSASPVAGHVIPQVTDLELAGTNLLLQSATFSNASWTKTSVTVAADSTAAPNGVVEADTLTDNAAGVIGTVVQDVVIPNDALTRTLSVYLTAGTSLQTQVKLLLTGGVTPVQASVDINPVSGNIVAQSGSPTIQTLVVNGVNWFRVSIPVANNTTGNVTARCTITPDSNAASGVGSVIAWGAQLETGALPSGQIPTTTAQVTRVAGKLPPWLLDPTPTTVPTAASAATTLAGTDTTQFLTAGGFAGNKLLNASAGYYKLPSGWIIQWVNNVTCNTGTTTTVTWPVAFPTQCVAVVSAPNAFITGQLGSISRTVNDVGIGNNSGTNITPQVIAIGY